MRAGILVAVLLLAFVPLEAASASCDFDGDGLDDERPCPPWQDAVVEPAGQETAFLPFVAVLASWGLCALAAGHLTRTNRKRRALHGKP